MKYGFTFPGGDARTAAECCRAAEEAGWDGFFVWEALWGVDAWVTLAACAMLTKTIRLGTMITPISRMRPWKLASETATLDRLSGGRVILAVGLGAVDTGFAEFGEETDRKTRAELVDEGLEILTGLWRGQPFSFEGKHYHIKEVAFFPPPPPVQQPRIPIWVVAAYPRPKSMRRALKYDGILPNVFDTTGTIKQHTPEDIRELAGYIRGERQGETPYDIVVEGTTPGNDPKRAAAAVRAWEDAGATWWIESMWDLSGKADRLAEVFERIRQGPPRGGN